MIISIDGPAGSGKSTVAKKLANKLGFIHFNSGSLYRAITSYIINEKIDINSMTEGSNLDLQVKFINNLQEVYVNGTNYTNYLRDNEVSNLTPLVSQNPYIRKIVDNCQRKFGENYDSVFDGRDIGSFVFPNADYKFYLDCDLSVRAKRRYKEEKQKNSKITLKNIEKELKIRDNIDKNKKIAPLIIPNNAILIDSTNLTIDEVVEKILKYIK